MLAPTPQDPLALLQALLTEPAIMRTLQLGGLVTTRLLPLIVMTPVFGGPAVPARLRFGVAMAFAAALVPALYSAQRPVFDTMSFMLLLLKEGLVGLVIAVAVTVVFQTFSAFGSLADLLRGEGQAMVHDPLVEHQQSVLSTFSLQLAVAVFLTIGGQRILFEALGQSFLAIRPESLALGGLNDPRGIAAAAGLLGHMLAVVLCLAAPVLIVTLLTDVSLALISRVAQQIEVTFVGLGVKTMLTLWLLFVSFAVLLKGFEDEFLRMAQQLKLMLG